MGVMELWLKLLPALAAFALVTALVVLTGQAPLYA
jgi:hypothetical protein